ncbi:hypothetical protein [Flaviaesturariibacter amylovorans]|uniref:Uncharacterized protein n=1 Tax=Flaviaesturariibacter amylovorans TaxID=1084520 RepID=A0ABP8HI71_9BACT
MLNSISWQGYWTFLALSTGLYYAFVYLRFFRGTLRLGRNRPGLADPGPSPNPVSYGFRPSDTPLPDRPGAPRRPAAEGPVEEVDETVLNTCLDELSAFFEASGKAGHERPELLACLQAVLAKYPALSHSTYKDAVTGLLVTQCKHYCGHDLDESDLRRVWSAR